MLVQGILLGFTLSFMVGPLLFAIVEAGLERGFRAGLAVAVGIWISDVFYVLAVWRGLEAMTAVVAWPAFKMWAGFAGGLLLIAFGTGSFFKKKISAEHFLAPTSTSRSLASYWLRGFLLNTINPFTVFFWIGIASGMVVPGNWSSAEIFLFFGAMLGTLVVTDTLKAYAAKRLRQWLTPQHIRHAQRAIGVLLIIFGIVMIGRVM